MDLISFFASFFLIIHLLFLQQTFTFSTFSSSNRLLRFFFIFLSFKRKIGIVWCCIKRESLRINWTKYKKKKEINHINQGAEYLMEKPMRIIIVRIDPMRIAFSSSTQENAMLQRNCCVCLLFYFYMFFCYFFHFLLVLLISFTKRRNFFQTQQQGALHMAKIQVKFS